MACVIERKRVCFPKCSERRSARCSRLFSTRRGIISTTENGARSFYLRNRGACTSLHVSDKRREIESGTGGTSVDERSAPKEHRHPRPSSIPPPVLGARIHPHPRVRHVATLISSARYARGAINVYYSSRVRRSMC